MELVYTLNGGEYGGKDLSVGGETYPVKRIGTRSLVYIPGNMAPLLKDHGFVPTGIAEAGTEDADAAIKAALKHEEDAAMAAAAAEGKGKK